MTTVAAGTIIPLLRTTKSVSPDAFAQIRRSMMLDHCKWDPQVGDRGTIAPFALRLSHSAWNTLKRLAQARRRNLRCRRQTPASLRTLAHARISPSPSKSARSLAPSWTYALRRSDHALRLSSHAQWLEDLRGQ